MARRIPPRKVTYFEPVPPRLARNTIIESTFDVGRRFREVSRRGTWIVAEAKSQIAMRKRIVPVVGLRHQCERLFELSLMEALQTEHAQADEARASLWLRLGERDIALGELARTRADDVGGDPFPVRRRQLQ